MRKETMTQTEERAWTAIDQNVNLYSGQEREFGRARDGGDGTTDGGNGTTEGGNGTTGR